MKITIGELRQLIREALINEVIIGLPDINEFKMKLSGLKGNDAAIASLLSKSSSPNWPRSIQQFFGDMSNVIQRWNKGKEGEETLQRAINAFYAKVGPLVQISKRMRAA